MNDKNLYIIAGCNGAGKTTASMSILPDVLDCEEFAIETTLATRSYKSLVARAKSLGYTVTLLFFWLPSPEMAEMRVASRVASGGHNIPKEVIHRRYWLGLQNLFDIFAPIVDYWSMYDNSMTQRPIVIGNEIIDSVKLSQIKQLCQSRKK